MAKKQKIKCPFCPQMIPSEGIGASSHIRGRHGEAMLQEWLDFKDKGKEPRAGASPVPIAATNGNGNGKHVEAPAGTWRCPHCSGVLLILPAVISSGKLNAEIVSTPGLELRNRA